ncbi:winged helix-turn-helix domain-containing protein [Litorihabitans aurantiacus]|uniref:Winged helix-turn-helix domain-containing protein n=1 Tax=Litorihabitans aurantiacus TaxID=1930061 RepID=A0AA37XFM8_9MICO|nr:crosslink repair DNA glycosylase YcaQ family protein [Litorihabitans aurantiacus]GMA31850.1 hypothetical protein GCM10025875_18420 [Litorihabitans aurantiacus]
MVVSVADGTVPAMEEISAALARRIALAAQGFGRSRRSGRDALTGGSARPAVGTRQLRAAVERLGVLQLDSVNVFERSHYLPLFARLGAYDKALLDRLTFTARSPFIEYWAHQASLVPVTDWPLWRWRQQEYRENARRPDSWSANHPGMLDFLRAELSEKGPLTAGAVEHEAAGRTGSWWGWSDVKRGLEILLLRGEVVAAGRTNFQRTYDLAERRLPADLLARDVPHTDAIRELVLISVRALGVGTVRDVADYFRLLQADTKRALEDLVEAGVVAPVRVRGWDRAAFLDVGARRPRRVEGVALLSPFDPVVWERERALRMFGFHYRIEIYTPAPKRVYGYYTLPLLQDEALVGRVDLKTDRQAGVLRVQSAWREPVVGAPLGWGGRGDGGASGVAGSGETHAVDLDRLAGHLRDIAAWQGMGDVVVAGHGDLSAELAGALGVRPGSD